ncbi:type I secretion system permease/ATPase [Photobacterium gaetbulicola]|nr:type I secretion system permease/ATPase [Photobacterium gaetbulicola]
MTAPQALNKIYRYHDIITSEHNLIKNYSEGADFFDIDSIQRSAKKLGILAKYQKTTLLEIGQLCSPFMISIKNGQWAIVEQVRTDQVTLILDGGDMGSVDTSDFSLFWDGGVVTFEPAVESEKGFGFKWLISAFLRHRAVIFQLLLASLFLQCFALVTPFFFQVVVDKILVHHNIDTLILLTVGMVVVSFCDVSLALLRDYIFYHTITRIDASLGSKVFSKLMALPFSYFSKNSVGQILSRVRELENISQFLNDSTVTMIIDLAFTLVLLSVMYLYSPVLTMVVIASVVLYVVLLSFNVPAFFKNLDQQFGLGARNNSFLVENVSGIETLKSLGIEGNMSRQWDTILAEFVQVVFKGKMIQARGIQGVELISKLTTVFVLYIGANLVMSGGMTIGQLIAFSMLTTNIMMPVIRLAHLWQSLQKARVAVVRLAEILNADEESQPKQHLITPKKLEGKIELEDVSFSYLQEGPSTLDQVSITINEGEVVGVVGRSGSGKSTLVRMLNKLYQPDSGHIFYDGQDIRHLDGVWLRQQIGVVLQDNVLFATTVKNNIAMGDPSLSLEQVIEAAKLVGAHDFIMQMPHGYDTVLEERGGNLSGGQRQRIAIARALVTDPGVLILDEATSALDYQSEHIIQERMKEICSGRTVIIIAHRLSTVRDADRIITMDQGRIVEQGSHQELCRSGGTYAQLYKQQAGGELCLVDG